MERQNCLMILFFIILGGYVIILSSMLLYSVINLLYSVLTSDTWFFSVEKMFSLVLSWFLQEKLLRLLG